MFAVIAVPQFSASATAWIDAVRRAHDPRHEQVAAHVTLSFPHEPADADWFAGHVASVAAVTPAFEAGFDRLGRIEDSYAPKYRFLNVLLADAESAAPLTALYQSLGGQGAYEPHVTLTRFGAVFSAKAFERQTGALVHPITGRIALLQLLKIEHGNVRVVSIHPLSSPRE